MNPENWNLKFRFSIQNEAKNWNLKFQFSDLKKLELKNWNLKFQLLKKKLELKIGTSEIEKKPVTHTHTDEHTHGYTDEHRFLDPPTQ